MMDLFRSEWRRFRRLTVGVAVMHLLLLGFMGRAVEVTELGYQDELAMLAVYMLLALTLAVLQVGSYRPASRWLWLVHRPIAPSRIFAAMALAAAASITLAIVAPLVVLLVGIDTLTTHIVDARHYGSVLHAFAFGMMAWLAGAHACTSRHRAAVAVLLAPLLLALKAASVWALLPLAFVSLLWMMFIAGASFRPNRQAPIAHHSTLILTALPLQIAFFFLTFQVAKNGIALAEVVRRGTTSRTIRASDAAVDVEAEVRSVGIELWADALAPSTDPRSARWRQELAHARLATVASDIDRFPVRHQFGSMGGGWWEGRRNVKWAFSHDAMMYHGRNPRSGASVGWWGTGGRSSHGKYLQVPVGNMTRSSLYAIDRDTVQQREIIALPAGEWFTGRPIRALDHQFLLTNHRLLAYARSGDSLAPPPATSPQWQLAVEDEGLVPITAEVAEVSDGWLVSLFYFDDWEYEGFTFLLHPWQRVLHVNAAGRAAVVAERREIRDHQVSLGNAASIPVASWWASPPLYALAHMTDVVDAGLVHPPRFELIPRAPALQLLAAALMIGSAIAAWFWLRAARVSASRRQLWLASCLLLGVPGLLSLLCIESRATRCR